MNKTEKLIVKKAVEAKITFEHLFNDKDVKLRHKLNEQIVLFTFIDLVEELGLLEEYHKLLKKELTSLM